MSSYKLKHAILRKQLEFQKTSFLKHLQTQFKLLHTFLPSPRTRIPQHIATQHVPKLHNQRTKRSQTPSTSVATCCTRAPNIVFRAQARAARRNLSHLRPRRVTHCAKPINKLIEGKRAHPLVVRTPGQDTGPSVQDSVHARNPLYNVAIKYTGRVGDATYLRNLKVGFRRCRSDPGTVSVFSRSREKPACFSINFTQRNRRRCTFYRILTARRSRSRSRPRESGSAVF